MTDRSLTGFGQWVVLVLALSVATVTAAESVWDKGSPVLEKPVPMTVYRSPNCSCCGLWVNHMRRNGFVVTDIKTEGMADIKKRLGVPEKMQSCHTAEVGGRWVEGHVPAADVRDLLKAAPEVRGLAVPGMVSGSPGMELGGPKAPFSVIEVDDKGQGHVFHEYKDY